MNNEIAHERLKLVVELRKASERYLEISRDFDNQADEINREIEAYYAAESSGTEPSDDEHDRPASVQVLDRRDPPSFERLAAAVAEQQDRVEAGKSRRRPPVADNSVLVIRTQHPVVQPNIWTRITTWWAERSSERSLPVGW